MSDLSWAGAAIAAEARVTAKKHVLILNIGLEGMDKRALLVKLAILPYRVAER
jgi:hypothetical protein